MTTPAVVPDIGLKCESHNKPATLFCDEEKCKVFICSECIEKGTHSEHQVFGIGVLNKKEIGEKLKEKKDEVVELKTNCINAEKDLEQCKLTCDTFKTEIEKIFETDLGKVLMASVAGNKTDLVASCVSIADKIKDFTTKLKEIPSKCDGVSKGLTLTNVLTKGKTIDEKVLIKELNLIADPLLKDGKALLDKLAKEKIKDKIEEFKKKFHATPSTGKKGKEKTPKAEEASPMSPETKDNKAAEDKKEKKGKNKPKTPKKDKKAEKEEKEKKKGKKGEDGEAERGSPTKKKKKESE